MKKVIAWSVTVVWSDNTEENISLPHWASDDVNTYLDELEQERNKEEVTNDSDGTI